MLFEPSNPDQPVWDCALRLLSRRDHSRRELEQKLRQRQFDEDAIVRTLNKLEQQQWLQDARFAQVQVRQHIYKKHGPLRIRTELQHKGVAAEEIATALEQQDTDWFELARECYLGRFGEGPVTDFKERAKRMRYLQARGFAPDHIRYALESSKE
ncbi:regulatory protein RecX [Oceanimonas baumannii]|uniref:Regulatory protein RecX n=1 Tax=Oceanimonas baumannii TaxID=129578 RepID=A0A235CLX7_9GAMM|nr:regulatory protein RecX [Oceanimonas baumannii]OYD25436.1 RecX family transcriptional regulator [Oceanimonas baumannii]TDW61368.1 regulatory protein [Oceanimonas baumannii]